MPIINQVVKGGGTTPTGTKSITANGVYDVTDFASADVQVPTTAPEIYRVFRVNNGKIENSISTPFLPLPSTATDISDFCFCNAYKDTPFSVLSGAINLSSLTTISGQYACQSMFQGCTGLTSVDLSGLTTVSGTNGCAVMFKGCTGLTSVDLSSLTTLPGNPTAKCCANMFQDCTGLTSVDLSSLTTVSGSNNCQGMFQGCTGLTSVDLSGLTTVSSMYGCTGMFRGCTGLTSVDLSSLTRVTGMNGCRNLVQDCTALTRLSFYALEPSGLTQDSAFNDMLQGVTGCTVHFPMRIQATIGSWSSVTGGFGGTSTTVLFDIVCTLTGADTNTYTRSQKNSTSTATAWDNGGTLYYTSGTTEPAVSDTIYSDAACTTAVTTISSIA